VFEAMRPYFTEQWGNPSSSYKFGAKLKTVIETARAQVAELIGAQSREVIFTSCATESNNAAIHAALKANPGKRHIVTSAVEHSPVYPPRAAAGKISPAGSPSAAPAPRRTCRASAGPRPARRRCAVALPTDRFAVSTAPSPPGPRPRRD